jgi:hypothetical protein
VLGHGHGYASGGPVASFADDAASAVSDWINFASDWHILHTHTKPAGASTSVWNAWNADMAIAANAANMIAKYIPDFKTPSSVTMDDFTAIAAPAGIQVLSEVMQGHSPGQQYWTSGVYPSAQLASYWPQDLTNTNTALNTFITAFNAAQAAFNSGDTGGGGSGGGSGGGGGSTGPVIIPTPIGAPRPIATTAKLVNLQGYATMGGPGAGVNPAGIGTMGFAAGGGLGETASMFALTIPVHGGQLQVAMPAHQLGHLRRAQEMPRTLSAAATGSGNRVGLNVESMTVNNPVPEPANVSITKSVNRLAFLAGRGV